MIARPIWRSIARRIGQTVNASPSTPTRGPELVTTPIGTGWTASIGDGTVVINANNVTFVGAAQNAQAFIAATLESDTLYEVIYTASAVTAGSVRAQAVGPATGKTGSTTARTAAGTYTEQVTTNGAGGTTNRIAVQARGATTNSATITSISVKKVLVPGS